MKAVGIAELKNRLQVRFTQPVLRTALSVLRDLPKDFYGLGVRAMAEIARDNVKWGSDYPPRDGTWPSSQKVIEDQCRDIDDAMALNTHEFDAASARGCEPAPAGVARGPSSRCP